MYVLHQHVNPPCTSLITYIYTHLNQSIYLAVSFSIQKASLSSASEPQLASARHLCQLRYVISTPLAHAHVSCRSQPHLEIFGPHTDDVRLTLGIQEQKQEAKSQLKFLHSYTSSGGKASMAYQGRAESTLVLWLVVAVQVGSEVKMERKIRRVCFPLGMVAVT